MERHLLFCFQLLLWINGRKKRAPVPVRLCAGGLSGTAVLVFDIIVFLPGIVVFLSDIVVSLMLLLFVLLSAVLILSASHQSSTAPYSGPAPAVLPKKIP